MLPAIPTDLVSLWNLQTERFFLVITIIIICSYISMFTSLVYSNVFKDIQPDLN